MEQSGLWARLRSTPCLLAILGLAFLNTAREAYRYPLLLHVDTAGLVNLSLGPIQVPLANLITLVGLALLAFVCLRGHAATAFHPVGLFAAAVVMTLGYFGKFDVAGSAEAYGVLQVLAEFVQPAGFYLLAGWAHALYRREGLFALALVAASYVLSGIFQVAILLVRPEAGIIICSMASVLSAMLLFVYAARTADTSMLTGILRRRLSDLPARPECAVSSPAPETQASSRKPWRFAVCFLVYGILGYYQFANWQSAQALAGGPTMIQVFGGAGTVLAGALLLCMLAKSRYPSNEFVYRALLLLVLVISAFISAVATSFAFASAFTVFVDLSYKVIMFYAWLIAATYAKNGNRVCAFLQLFLIHQLGALLGTLAAPVAGLQFGLIVACLVFLVADFAASLISKDRPMAAEDEFAAERLLAEQRQAFEDERAKMDVYKQLLFKLYLMDAYGLTQRECEVLDELLLDKKPREIAETLVVSLDTAKTHRRNIYQKMQVTDARDLKDKVAQAKETDFPVFLQKVAAEARP